MGKPFSVICPAAGYPLEKVTWTKGELLNISGCKFNESFCPICGVDTKSTNSRVKKPSPVLSQLLGRPSNWRPSNRPSCSQFGIRNLHVILSLSLTCLSSVTVGGDSLSFLSFFSLFQTILQIVSPLVVGLIDAITNFSVRSLSK